MSSTPPPPPPPPPATGYERQYYPMPPVPAPPVELIVFLLAWVVALIVTVAADEVGWGHFLTATTLISAAFIICQAMMPVSGIFGKSPSTVVMPLILMVTCLPTHLME